MPQIKRAALGHYNTGSLHDRVVSMRDAIDEYGESWVQDKLDHGFLFDC